MEPYFENAFSKITHLPELNAILIEWKHFKTISLEDYQTTFIKAQELQKVKNPENLITDSRLQGIINPNLRKWLVEESMPKGVKLGMKKAAVVSDVNVFKRYYFNKILKSINKFKIPFKMFNDIEKAKIWLKG